MVGNVSEYFLVGIIFFYEKSSGHKMARRTVHGSINAFLSSLHSVIKIEKSEKKSHTYLYQFGEYYLHGA